MGEAILVTGAGGQLGRALVEAAAEMSLPLAALPHAELDIADEGAVRRLFASRRFAAAINAAAYTDVEAAEADGATAFRVNEQGARHLALACRQAEIPLLQVSTDYVFDGTLGRPYREADAANPLNLYGLSKYRGEQAVAAAWPRHVILRVGWCYSLAGRNFVTRMVQRAREGGEVPVVADQIGAPTHHFDIAKALLTIGDRLIRKGAHAPYGTYHFAGQGAASRAEVAEAIFAHLRARESGIGQVRRVLSADLPRLARRPANSRLECSRIARVFGLRPPPWQARLAEVLLAADGVGEKINANAPFTINGETEPG